MGTSEHTHPVGSATDSSPTGSQRRRGPGTALLLMAVGVILASCAGQASPDDVVEDFFIALEEENILGATGHILPSEHGFIIEPLIAGLDEAIRLGILSEVDLDDLQGLEIDFGELTYEVEELAEDLVWVGVSGDASFGARAEELPLGSLLEDLLPDDWADDIEESPDPSPIEEGFGLAVVLEDGDWYVSLAHTVAETARREADLPFPTEQPLGAPVGAATPEEALEQAALAAIHLDVRALVDVLVPAETAAFRRYAQLFIDEWDSGITDFQTSMADAGFSYSVDEVVSGSNTVDGDTVAWIEDVPTFQIVAEVPDAGTLTVARSEGCLTADIPPVLLEVFVPLYLGEDIDLSQFDGETCIESDPTATTEVDASQQEIFFEFPVFGPVFERWFESLENLAEAGASAVQFQVEEVEGRWFVSMAGTINRWILAFSGTLDQELITEVAEGVQQASEDPDGFELMMEEWLTGVIDSGLLGEVPVFGPDVLAPFADSPNVLLVWGFDTGYVVGEIEATYGPGIVIDVIAGPDLHEIFVTRFGLESTAGIPPDEFPEGILIGPVDVDTLVGIFNWPEILDMYRAAQLGVGIPGSLITGEEAVIAALTQGCEDGDFVMCDVLFLAAPFDSELETFADTCGGRTDGGLPCAEVFEVEIDLEALLASCRAGDMLACDQLFIYAGARSAERQIGGSCGGLGAESRTCVVDHGLLVP